MYRSPFKAGSKETCSFKKKGSWKAGYHTLSWTSGRAYA